MIESVAPRLPLSAERSPMLHGPVRLPGDPALSAFALLLAAMARGNSVLGNLSGNTGPVLAALAALGVQVEAEPGRCRVRGLGVGGLLAPQYPLDLAAAGTAGPLLVGLCGAHEMDVAFTGLEAQPLSGVLLDFLRRNGARVTEAAGMVTLRGPRFPIPMDLAMSAEARGLIAPLLLHCLAVAGASTLHLPPGISDPAEALLDEFGAKVSATADADGTRLRLEGLAPLSAKSVAMPGDPCLAAYPIVAALITADSEITARDVSLSPGGMALLGALQQLGADITLVEARRGVADITARHSRLRGAPIPTGHGIAMEDLPILAVAAAFAEGETSIDGLSDASRLVTLARLLRANGASCAESPTALTIRGQAKIAGGGNVATRLDPKLAMAFLVLGLATQNPVTIDDGAVMDSIFPGFVLAFEHVGARFSGPGAA